MHLRSLTVSSYERSCNLFINTIEFQLLCTRMPICLLSNMTDADSITLDRDFCRVCTKTILSDYFGKKCRRDVNFEVRSVFLKTLFVFSFSFF